MLIADKLVFVSLHKHGVGPVKRLLEQVLGGQTRKDDAPPSELLALNRPVLGFVCHPMSWYLALWRQGCEGKGGVHRRLTDATRWQRAGANRPAAWSAEHAKRAWYGRGEQPEAFREWLLAVLGTPALRRVVDAAATPAQAQWLGLMTRDYLRAYVPEAVPAEPWPESLAELQRLDAQRSLVKHMIRAERASEDMAALMQAMGQTLAPEQQLAQAKLTRRVSHSSDWAEFYDEASRQLLLRHEPFMLARWGYEVGPATAAAAPTGRAKPAKPAKAANAAEPGAKAARQAQKRAARAAGQPPAEAAVPAPAASTASAEPRFAEQAAGTDTAAQASEPEPLPPALSPDRPAPVPAKRAKAKPEPKPTAPAAVPVVQASSGTEGGRAAKPKTARTKTAQPQAAAPEVAKSASRKPQARSAAESAPKPAKPAAARKARPKPAPLQAEGSQDTAPKPPASRPARKKPSPDRGA